MTGLEQALTWLHPALQFWAEVRSKAFNQDQAQAPLEKRATCRVRRLQPETGIGQILPNTLIKNSHLIAPYTIKTDSKDWNEYFDGFYDNFLAEEEAALWDQVLLGLGWLVLELPQGSDVPQAAAVDLVDMLWHPRYRIDKSPAYWRRMRLTREELSSIATHKDKIDPLQDEFEVFVEYTDQRIRLIGLTPPAGKASGSDPDAKATDRSEIVYKDDANPCVYNGHPLKPVTPLLYIYPFDMDIPMGDWELCAAHDLLLTKMLRYLIESAQLGPGAIFVNKNMVEPGEIDKLDEDSLQLPIIEYNDITGGSPAHAVDTPGMAGEAMALYQEAYEAVQRNSGVTAALQGQTATKQAKFATEFQQISQGAQNRLTKALNDHNQARKHLFRCLAYWTISRHPTGYPFGETATPTTPPRRYSIQDQSALLQDKEQSLFLLSMFKTQVATLPVNVQKLVEQILTKQGSSKEDVTELLEGAMPPMLPGLPPMGQPDTGAGAAPIA